MAAATSAPCSSALSLDERKNMKRPPTDLEILEEIYDRYYTDFCAYSKNNKIRKTKNYVPIDIQAIADHFSVDGDIVHGRLYYHLDHKYGIISKDGDKVPFFLFVENSTPEICHQVQFPILASAIAELRETRNQFLWATCLAAASFIIALLALIVSIAS
jgi:hypothetical protein